MIVGEIIRERRKAIGMTPEELADKIGVSRATIYRYESNKVGKMPINSLCPLAHALRTTPAELMGWKQNHFSITDKEKIHITKYRAIPDASKALVDERLDLLYEMETQKARQEAEPETMAANQKQEITDVIKESED